MPFYDKIINKFMYIISLIILVYWNITFTTTFYFLITSMNNIFKNIILQSALKIFIIICKKKRLKCGVPWIV